MKGSWEPVGHLKNDDCPRNTCVISLFRKVFIGLSRKLKLITQSYRHKFGKLRFREKEEKNANSTVAAFWDEFQLAKPITSKNGLFENRNSHYISGMLRCGCGGTSAEWFVGFSWRTG